MQSALILVALAALVAPAFATFLIARNGDGYGWGNDYNSWNTGYNHYNGYNGLNNGWGYNGNHGYYSSPYHGSRSYFSSPYGARSSGYGAYGDYNKYNNYNDVSYSYPTNYYNSHSSLGYNNLGAYNGLGYHNDGYGSFGNWGARSLVIPSYGGRSAYGYLYKKK